MDLEEKLECDKVLFEVDLRTYDENVSGYIDVVLSGPSGLGLIDFKRSGGGVPSATQVLTFEKCQLWFYLNHIKYNVNKLIFFGYFNLKDSKESMFWSREQFKDVFPIVSKIKMKKEFPVIFSDYVNYEQKVIERMEQDKDFLPNPKNVASCTYCPIRNICDRGILL